MLEGADPTIAALGRAYTVSIMTVLYNTRIDYDSCLMYSTACSYRYETFLDDCYHYICIIAIVASYTVIL